MNTSWTKGLEEVLAQVKLNGEQAQVKLNGEQAQVKEEALAAKDNIPTDSQPIETLGILKEQVANSEQVKQIRNQIHVARDLDHIFVDLMVMDDILKLFDSEHLTIYAVDHDKKEIYSRFVDSAALGEIKEIRLPINERSIAGFVAMDRRVVNISDAYDKAELAKINPALSFDSSWDEKTGFRTRQVLAVPVLSSNDLLTGVIKLINKKGGDGFTAEEERRLQEIARTLGIALFNEFQLARKKLTKFDYLLSSGFVTQSELDATITEAREKRRDVESLLMEKYKIAKKDIGKSLSLFYKCPFVDHEDRIFIQGRVERLWGTFQDQLVTELRLAGAKTKEEAQAVLPELVKDINLGYLKANFWIPLRCDKDKVEVAIDDPYSFQKIQDIRRLFPIKLYVGLREDILKFVNSISLDPGSDVSAGEGSITGIIDELKTEEQQEDDQPEGPVPDENDNAVVRLANQIVADAYRAGASDIHIEPRLGRRETVIRFRVDGQGSDC